MITIHELLSLFSLQILFIIFAYSLYKKIAKPLCKGGYFIKTQEIEAVEFADWIESNSYFRSSNDLWYYKTDGNPEAGITTIELYKIFKKETTL